VVDARAGVQGVTHDLVGSGDGRPGKVLIHHEVGQRALAEQLAGDAQYRRGGLAVRVVVEETRGDDGRVARQPAAEMDRARRSGADLVPQEIDAGMLSQLQGGRAAGAERYRREDTLDVRAAQVG
jgi:hypothetical protein